MNERYPSSRGPGFVWYEKMNVWCIGWEGWRHATRQDNRPGFDMDIPKGLQVVGGDWAWRILGTESPLDPYETAAADRFLRANLGS